MERSKRRNNKRLFWLDQKPAQLRQHLKGELFAPLFREKQEEMFNDTKVSNKETNEGETINAKSNIEREARVGNS